MQVEVTATEKVDVTEEDQAAADAIELRSSWRNFLIARLFTTHREAARIEGIRLGLEAAAGVCERKDGRSEWDYTGWDFAQRIRTKTVIDRAHGKQPDGEVNPPVPQS